MEALGVLVVAGTKALSGTNHYVPASPERLSGSVCVNFQYEMMMSHNQDATMTQHEPLFLLATYLVSGGTYCGFGEVMCFVPL